MVQNAIDNGPSAGSTFTFDVQEAKADKTTIPMTQRRFMFAKVNKKPRHKNLQRGKNAILMKKYKYFILLLSGSLRTP